MRILQIHCYKFSYEVRKETPVAEQPPNPRKEDLNDVLVCFICYEKNDENREDEIAEKFLQNLKIDVGRIKCKRLLLYPYAHLSNNLGSPKRAKTFLNSLRDRLLETGIEVYKSPFGWYKEFTLSCIGHPLAEAYREY
ncbi:threonyl-tRNA synthetase editing domain-containing protein [Candidatus Bathyarchaeota archaeon]|nr:threonyl-tRNA synthetase editing domain-containing protein [Candidatus Bathyarchaeota archaeon]MBS7630954.1 threonyl-tRNA synthetase editing domain-containing protein [Candidatus Bathyarchaeota archaeon]